VEKGGHAVNVKKIKSRYGKTLRNLYPSIMLANRVYLFGNSGKTLELIAEIFDDALQLKVGNLPDWFIEFVLLYYQQ